MHEHKPINHDHEIICSECGIVIATVIEFPTPIVIPQALSAMFHTDNQFERNQQYAPLWHTHDESKINQCMKVFDRLTRIIEKEHLPIQYAHEAMRIIMLRKKGLWSYKWQLITLIQVLQNTNDIRMRNHIRHIKELLKTAIGT